MKSCAPHLALTILLLGCSAESELPAGYALTRIDSANRAIVDGSNEFVVFPDIQSCRVIGKYVVGTRVRSDFPIIPEDMEHQQSDGSFVLDLSDGSLRTGVSQGEIKLLAVSAVNGSDCMPFRLIGR